MEKEKTEIRTKEISLRIEKTKEAKRSKEQTKEQVLLKNTKRKEKANQ